MSNVPAGYGDGFTGQMSLETLAQFILDTVSQNSAPFNDAVITDSTIDSSVIGGTTPAAGHFTTLGATNAVTLSPASHNVVISPSGSGVVTISPATLGTLDKVTIGGTTPAAATVTAFTASGVASFSNASVSMSDLPSADPHVAGRLWANSGVVTVSAG